MKRQQNHRDPRDDEADAGPASAIQASAQRRVNSASIENPTPNTRASQLNTRDGSAIAAFAATGPPISASTPRAPPAWGNRNDTSRTNTKIATIKALAPGWISPATRRSAASM